MLRITVHDKPRALTFQLEGSLAGAWVRVLEECWQGTLARRRQPDLRIDLTGVTFIDAAGRACLVAMHQQGAEFVAADCLTRGIVAEITQGYLPGGLNIGACGTPMPTGRPGADSR
jgi:anti-anti-sigma regulatory factor